MNEIQLHALVLSLQIIKELLRETPEVYHDLEHTGMKHAFKAMDGCGLSVAAAAEILRCTEQELHDKMAAMKVRLHHVEA
jgi:hypothetical protein